MTEEQEALIQMKKLLNSMPTRDRVQAKTVAELLRRVVDENDDLGMFALWLVVLEFSVKQQ